MKIETMKTEVLEKMSVDRFLTQALILRIAVELLRRQKSPCSE
jgi:hypothetical protein